MKLSKEEILAEIDGALQAYDTARSQCKSDTLSGGPILDRERIEILLSLAAAIEKYAPRGCTQRKSFDESVEKRGLNGRANLINYYGILKTLKREYEAGYMETVQELVHAEVFIDYLEMAKYLIEEQYKDAAAVIIGSTLENHLRNLCRKHGIPTERHGKYIKGEELNASLRKHGIYDLGDQKSITSWLDLRNKAAHGRYSEYTKEQIKIMLMGVRNFLQRNPG